MTAPDLSSLPVEVRDKATVRRGDMSWRPDDAEEALRAIAGSGFVILGLDLQRPYADGGVMEIAWSSFESDGDSDDESNIERSLQAALEALARDDRPPDFEWVRVVWVSPDWLTQRRSHP